MNIVEFLKVLVFSLVEGFTEWLPISSTGHLILLQDIIPLGGSKDFFSTFEVLIQLGAVFAFASGRLAEERRQEESISRKTG